MGKLRFSRPSVREDDIRNRLKLSKQKSQKHPVETAGWWSIATFSWMSRIMYSSYRRPLDLSDVPMLPEEETCRLNTDTLEQLWAKEVALKCPPKFGRVLWHCAKKHILVTTSVFLVTIILGFCSSVVLLKRVLDYASDPNGKLTDGILRVSLLILCEFLRVFFFTLTWALSYRTAIRLKSACMGLVYRKLFRLASTSDKHSAKILNLILSDCHRIYEVVVSTQVAIGGPITLLLGAAYITWELGFVSLIGMLVFPASYPVQYLLAKGSASLKRKALNFRDTRIMLLTQSIHNLKFLKMFAWEKHFGRLITETRRSERLELLKSQILTSFSIVLSPMLPHVGAITTFILYISMGNHLTPAQAFCVVSLFVGRIRPTLNAIRVGFRAYVNSLISIQLIQYTVDFRVLSGGCDSFCFRLRYANWAFTTLFLFSLFAYATRTISRLLDLKNMLVISLRRLEVKIIHSSMRVSPKQRVQSFISNGGAVTGSHPWMHSEMTGTFSDYEVMALPEVPARVPHYLQDGNEDSIIVENLAVVRRVYANDLVKAKKKNKNRRRKDENAGEPGSIEKLMGSTDSDFLTFQLENINVTIKKGSFIGICGHVGSGKSTFLETVAGSISYEKGNLNVFGKIAYVPQEPWIFKGTLRENIQFGEVFEPVRYYNVISSCCLVNDFGNFGQGDLTETSDNGGNISGGQKQRLALARALYHFPVRDIYLLDDPLSGLDDRVASTIFEKVVVEQLCKEKTVILATHQLQFLRECDEILVFSEGRIVERGRHQDLIVYPNSQYATLVNATPQANVSSEELSLDDSDILDCSPCPTPLEPPQDSNDSSSSAGGAIPWQAYGLYIKSAGGPVAVALVLIVFAINIGSTAFSSWWLKNWFKASRANSTVFEDTEMFNYSSTESIEDITSTPPENTIVTITMDSPDFSWYRDVYAGIIGVIFLTSFVRTLLFVFTTLRAAQNIHQSLLLQFFKSRLKSIEWFGTGQVLHIFTRDMGEVDGGLPNSMEFLLQNIFLVISILVIVSVIFPMFLIPLVLLFAIFILVRRIYNTAIRDLKRFESDSKTPIFTRVTETISGMGTIRAFGKEQQMINGFEELTDWNNSVFYIFVSAMRWLAFRLDTLAVSVTATTAIFVLIFSGSVSPASCGLALSYAAQLSGIFQFTVRMASEVEAKFVCVERMNRFLTTTQTEEPVKTESSEDGGDSVTNLVTHPNWPFAGRLKFHAVNLSYSSEAEPALRNLTVEIPPGSKIGIIGRTGSGKSSIGNALFRLNELRSGYIYLDDVDIATVPLPKLRSSLCVIPQDAAIFHKSARFNLDPGNEHLDAELWAVLEKVGLKSSIESLDAEVALSQGQKQMLSIGRAILRQSKVVFVDEATSNVDVETATVMDQLIMEEFSCSTVLIVAHRLQALKYCQYLLVMEEGELKDFGPLEVIGRKPEFLSHFEKFETIPL